jgi:hypothetical protein
MLKENVIPHNLLQMQAKKNVKEIVPAHHSWIKKRHPCTLAASKDEGEQEEVMVADDAEEARQLRCCRHPTKQTRV